ncbi:hypothetical protein Tco_0964590 [Tanacetum coccineum]
MKMEILLEPTSNKLMVERFYTSAGNPIKEILLKLNLPDHRILKDGSEGTEFQLTHKIQVEPSKTEYINSEEADDTDEEVESKKEVKEETEGEPEKEEEDDPEHFDTFPTMNELSVIDHYLGSMVFGKPFVEATGLVYNKEEGTVVFERNKEKIVFKMPHKMNMFKHIDFADIHTDRIPTFIIESDDDNCEKTHYSDNLDLGHEYKYDEYVCRGIRSLMATKATRKNKGEITFGMIGIHGSNHLMKNWGRSRKAHLLENKQISSVGVFDEVFSTWMTFGGNTRDLGSFGEETDEIMDLHQILEEILLTEMWRRRRKHIATPS